MTDKKHQNSTPSEASQTRASTQPPKSPAATQAQAPHEPAKPGPAEKEPKGAAGQPRTEKTGPGGPGGGQVPPKGVATPPPPRKGGRGLAILALLIALAAAGGSAYVWYLWQQAQQERPDWSAQLNTRLDQAMTGVAEQRKTALQDLENRLQTRQEEVRQALNSEIQTVKSEIQSLRDNLQAQRGDTETLRTRLSGLEGELQNLQNRLTVRISQLSEHLQEERETIAQLDNRIENLQLGQRGLVNTLEAVKVLAARGGDVNALPLSEVEYLLRLAHHKLQFQQDVEAALNALKIANQRLETIGEEAFNTVQRMIRENIAALQGVDLPDRSALAHKIAEMAEQVDNLPIQIEKQMAHLKEKVAPAGNGEGEAAPETEIPWWERAADATWRQFKDIVIVRRERASGPPLIAPEEEYFLRQNLRLELEAMRLTLLGGDATNYQESNETAREWIRIYFDTNDEQVQEFLNELQALQAVQFHPYIPDISNTLRAFREVMERREPVRSVISGATGTTINQEGDEAGEAQP